MKFNKIIPELSITNLENSLKFYKTLGFKIEYERPENKFAFLSLGEIQFMIQEITDNDKWDIAPLSYPFGNGINFQLEVDNVEHIYNNLLNNNYKIAFEKFSSTGLEIFITELEITTTDLKKQCQYYKELFL